MATIAELRQEAKRAGVPISELRGLTAADEIQAVIDRHTGTSTARPVKKKHGAVAKKKTAARKSASARKSTTARKSAGRKSVPARSRKSGTAKRQTTAKRTTAKKSTTARKSTAKRSTARHATDNSGRHTLNGIDYSITDGWNPREGSAPDRILKALKKARGNRTKAFEALKGDVWNFVKRTDSKGRRRKLGEAHWQLRYRISRTAWDFAKRTGQHEPSTNRATYGEGGTGIGVSGGMPVAFRPDDFSGKPVFKRGGSRKATSRKAAGATQTARKTAARKKTAASRSGAKKRSTARKTVARSRK